MFNCLKIVVDSQYAKAYNSHESEVEQLVTFSLRMSEEVNNELQFLATMFDKSKTAVLESLIRQEYHKYQEDPKIKRAIEQMQELKSVFEKFKDENR